MSEVLYARVPSETKGAIDAFAGANGRSVAAAVAELLSRGLQATSQSSQIAELQERLQRTELACLGGTRVDRRGHRRDT